MRRLPLTFAIAVVVLGNTGYVLSFDKYSLAPWDRVLKGKSDWTYFIPESALGRGPDQDLNLKSNELAYLHGLRDRNKRIGSEWQPAPGPPCGNRLTAGRARAGWTFEEDFSYVGSVVVGRVEGDGLPGYSPYFGSAGRLFLVRVEELWSSVDTSVRPGDLVAVFVVGGEVPYMGTTICSLARTGDFQPDEGDRILVAGGFGVEEPPLLGVYFIFQVDGSNVVLPDNIGYAFQDPEVPINHLVDQLRTVVVP